MRICTKELSKFVGVHPILIAIFGESCTGKSTLAGLLREKLDAKVYSGKDYLRLAKNEDNARAAFVSVLEQASLGDSTVIYVISEPKHLSLLPKRCLRVRVTAPLSIIQSRFAYRMGGTLPQVIAERLAAVHGAFDNVDCDIAVDGSKPAQGECERILEALQAQANG